MNPVTFNISVGAIPENFEGNLQATLELFASRLIISPSVPWSSFVVGGAQPSSNVGPWLKDSIELWVWSDTLATYVPQQINSESLRYVVGTASPDPTKFDFWIDTNSPSALKIYNGSAWVDVYATKLGDYSTTTQMNTAISNAVSNLPYGKDVFSVTANSTQNVVFGSAGAQGGVIVLDVENFDPDGRFGSNKFTAPVDGYYQFNFGLGVSITGGSPTNLTLSGRLAVNGSPVSYTTEIEGTLSKNGGVFNGSALVYLTAGSLVDFRYYIISDAAVTVQIEPTYTRLSGHRVR